MEVPEGTELLVSDVQPRRLARQIPALGLACRSLGGWERERWGRRKVEECTGQRILSPGQLVQLRKIGL